MPKSSKEQVELDERKVLRELQKNSKESIDSIAKNCGFSRQKVWRVVKRLEKNKTIWGYGAIIDDEKINLGQYVVMVKRSIKPFDEKFQNRVCTEKIDEYVPDAQITIEDILWVNGKYDWIFIFTSPGLKETKKFCEKLMVMFGEYVESYDILETIIPIRKKRIKNPQAKQPEKLNL